MKLIQSTTKTLSHKVAQSKEIRYIKLSEALIICDLVAE